VAAAGGGRIRPARQAARARRRPGSVRNHAPPLVIIGPAGSGKTAVTLAKMREATGDVLYVTLSAYLAQTARRLYGAHGYENPQQSVDS